MINNVCDVDSWGKLRNLFGGLKMRSSLLAFTFAALLQACSSATTEPQATTSGNYVLVDSLANGQWVAVSDGELTISSNQSYSWRLGSTSHAGQWSKNNLERDNKAGEFTLLEGESNYFNWFVLDAQGYAWTNGSMPRGANIVAVAGSLIAPAQYAFRKR